MINLICALQCEAQPLVKYYQLGKDAASHVLPVYRDKNNTIQLVISGPGKINAAIATSYLHKTCTERPVIWLNIGIAGHQSINIGTPVLIHKIIDAATDQSWYPQILFDHDMKTGVLKTLDKPSMEHESVLFDMEASGFFSAAMRFGTMELIHSLKIVSDNALHPVVNPDKQDVSLLIKNNLQVFDDLIDKLIPIRNELQQIERVPEYYNDLIQKWHFTHYEKGILKQLLNRRQVLAMDLKLDEIIFACKTGKQIIKKLQVTLDDFSDPVNLPQ